MSFTADARWESELHERARVLDEHNGHDLRYAVVVEHHYHVRHVNGIVIEHQSLVSTTAVSSSIWCNTCNTEPLISNDDGALVQLTNHGSTTDDYEVSG